LVVQHKYSTTEEAAVIDITYNTIMNKVSYLPDNIKYFMQQQNTMKRIRSANPQKTPTPLNSPSIWETTMKPTTVSER
jgi:hypothetical protein